MADAVVAAARTSAHLSSPTKEEPCCNPVVAAAEQASSTTDVASTFEAHSELRSSFQTARSHAVSKSTNSDYCCPLVAQAPGSAAEPVKVRGGAASYTY